MPTNQHSAPGLTYHEILKSENTSQMSKLLPKLNKYTLPPSAGSNDHAKN